MPEYFPLVVSGLIITLFVLLISIFILSMIGAYHRKCLALMTEMEETVGRHEKNMLDLQVHTRERLMQELNRDVRENILYCLTLSNLNLHTLSYPKETEVARRVELSLRLLRKTVARLTVAANVLDTRLQSYCGVEHALRKELEQLKRTGLFNVQWHTSGIASPLDHACVNALLGIFREAVRNIMHHAGATNVKVTLDFREEALLFRISDNGTGLASGKQSSARTAICKMRNYARAMKADLQINSDAQTGTEVSVHLPLQLKTVNGKRKHADQDSVG